MNVLYVSIAFGAILIIISFKDFLFHNISVNKKKIDDLESSYSSSDGVEFVRIRIKENLIDTESVDNYFSVIRKHLVNTKKSIQILDYLPSNNAMKYIDSVSKAESYKEENILHLKNKYEEYYNNLRDIVLNNKNIIYTRVIQISGLYRNTLPNNQLNCATRAISLMTPSLATHIFQMLKADLGDRFKLYILDKPAVTHDFMILDEEVVLSEYSRYNKKGVNFPDEMYVNLKSSIPQQIKKRCKLIKVLTKEKPTYSFDLMRYAFHEFENPQYYTGFDTVRDILSKN